MVGGGPSRTCTRLQGCDTTVVCQTESGVSVVVCGIDVECIHSRLGVVEALGGDSPASLEQHQPVLFVNDFGKISHKPLFPLRGRDP